MFVLHIVTLKEPTIMLIYLSCQAQVTSLRNNKNGIFAEYFNFFNIFFSDSVLKLQKHIKINNHFINLLNDKQLSYGFIFSIELIKLEMFKTYIQGNSTNSFIRLFKFFASILILFIKKKDISFYLNIDYKIFNIVTNKNYYLFFLINKLFNCLDHIKCFIQLDLINLYHKIRIWKSNK